MKKKIVKTLYKSILAIVALYLFVKCIRIWISFCGYFTISNPLVGKFIISISLLTSLFILPLSFAVLLFYKRNYTSRIKITIPYIGLIMVMLFIAWLFGISVFETSDLRGITKGWKSRLADKELPITDIGEIAVDDSGRIYLTIDKYDRIQVYDKNGLFRKGWFVETSGEFNIWLENGQLHVYQFRTHNYDIFTDQGDLINRREELNPYRITDFAQKIASFEAKDNAGNVYIAENPKWSPAIIKIDSVGNRNVLIKDPPYYQFLHKAERIRYAVIAFLIAFIYIIMIRYQERCRISVIRSQRMKGMK